MIWGTWGELATTAIATGIAAALLGVSASLLVAVIHGRSDRD